MVAVCGKRVCDIVGAGASGAIPLGGINLEKLKTDEWHGLSCAKRHGPNPVNA